MQKSQKLLALLAPVTLVALDPLASAQTADKPPTNLCIGTSRPHVRCEAIAAQAALDQTSYAARAYSVGLAQMVIAALTLAAAVAAAVFAAKAVTAARDALGEEGRRFDETARPWISLVSAQFEPALYPPVDNVFVGLRTAYKNIGTFPAEEVSVHAEFQAVRPPNDPAVVFDIKFALDEINLFLDGHLARERNSGGLLFPSAESALKTGAIVDIRRSLHYFPPPIETIFTIIVTVSLVYRSPKWEKGRFAQTAQTFLLSVRDENGNYKSTTVKGWPQDIGSAVWVPYSGADRLT